MTGQTLAGWSPEASPEEVGKELAEAVARVEGGCSPERAKAVARQLFAAAGVAPSEAAVAQLERVGGHLDRLLASPAALRLFLATAKLPPVESLEEQLQAARRRRAHASGAADVEKCDQRIRKIERGLARESEGR